MPRFTRMMQAEVLTIRSREYVTAARAIGASTPRILLEHILPNALSSMLVMSTLSISTAILAEATLSFLGLGPAAADADLGLDDQRRHVGARVGPLGGAVPRGWRSR